MRASAVPTWLCATAVAGWLCGTAYAFWAFAPEPGRPFLSPAQAATFDAQHRAAVAEAWFRAQTPAATGAATVVAVHASGCDCNRTAADHVARIARDYANRNVAVRHVVAHEAPVDAAPAALVFDARGRLVYYGPYDDAAWCGTGRDACVERARDAVRAGTPPTLRPILATGCFCPVAPLTTAHQFSSRTGQIT
jgi:hypothetical protein